MEVKFAAPLPESTRQNRSKFLAAIEADSTMAVESAESKNIIAANLMTKYDSNQDGTFGITEVVGIIKDLRSEEKAKVKAQRQLKWYTIVFITIVSSLALVIGVNAAITWITVDSAKDTETLKTLLTDRNGNVVAAKTAETTLPLIAAPVLDVATLASTDRLVITYALSPTATSIEASVRVSDVFKYSDRWAEFKLASPGAGVGTVVVKDGAAEYTNTDGNVYTVCAANASCSAFTVDEETEVEALVAAAQLALGNSSSAGRRRLDDPDNNCTSTYVESGYRYVFTDDTTFVSANEQLRIAVTSYLKDPDTATKTYGAISTWDTRHVTDMSFLFSGSTTFDADISGWSTGAVTNMQEMFKGASAFNQDISGWDVTRVYTMLVCCGHPFCIQRPHVSSICSPIGCVKASYGPRGAHTRAIGTAQPLRHFYRVYSCVAGDVSKCKLVQSGSRRLEHQFCRKHDGARARKSRCDVPIPGRTRV